MEDRLDMQTEDSRTSNLIREGEQGEVATAEGMGTMPCQNTGTELGGDNTRNKAELEFLDNVLGIMRYARGHLSQFPYIREQIEYWNEIVEAWEECTGECLVQGEMSDLEWAIECKDQDLLDEAIDELDDDELDEAIDALDEEKSDELKKLKPELFTDDENDNER